MAVIEIEMNIEQQGSSVFVASPTLSGQVYKLKAIWTYRSPDKNGSWYLNVDETVRGIKMVNGIDLLGPYHYIDTLPPGKLGVSRNKGTASKPAFFNFGIDKEMTLLYEEP